MNKSLKGCPFCGRTPKVLHRTDSLVGYCCAISCFCGGCSVRAYQAATGADESEAYMKAALRWNRRAEPENKPLTNADRIRSMTDEELAVWLVDANMCERVCAKEDYCGCDVCVKRVIDWLERPVEVVNSD